jgi:tripartite-type tricarboxylate transporter receptor subunit TctC
MKFSRLYMSVLALAAFSTVATTATAQTAQNYPSRQIRVIVPYAAGGATDAIARIMAEKIGPRLGQAVIVENKTGASGIVGTDAVAKAAPDGHTLMVSLTSSMLANQFLFEKLPYNPQKDIALVAQVALAPIVLLTHTSVPVNNGQELLQYIKNNKGKLSYGTYGIGSHGHLASAYMSQSQQADMSHVPYRGEAPMLQDLIAGRIQMGFASALSVKPFIEAGRLKAIGVTGEQRFSAMPNVPTLAEQGLKDDVYRITGWIGVGAPGGTPKAILQRVADEIKVAWDAPDVKAKISAIGFVPVVTGPDAFSANYTKDWPVWEKAVKQSGARIE